MMKQYILLTDASLNPQSNIGFGGYLFLTSIEWEEMEKEALITKIQLQQFSGTSVARLEIETLLWALKEIAPTNDIEKIKNQITLYTDSQCIVGLPSRRKKLEAKHFMSAAKKKPLRNADLYRLFYEQNDLLHFDIQKVKGHTPLKKRDKLHQTFSLVDQATRKALKKLLEDD